MRAKPVFSSISVVLLLLPVPGFAQDGERLITVDDILAIKSVGDPQVSPDGDWVAYTVRQRDMEEDKSGTQIWTIATSGGDPIPMTSAETSASNPRWSPDNRYLSFKASKGEKEKSQVWNLNRFGGEAMQVTSVKQGIESYYWSPDGSQMLLLIQDPRPADLTEDEKDDEKPLPHVIDRMQFKQDYVGYLDRRRKHIYVYTPGEEGPVQVTSGDYDDSDPVWSPDGKSIAFVSDRSEKPDLHYGTDIWTVSVDGDDHAPVQVTSHAGRDYSPAWSPDSKSIAYVSSTGMDIGGSALTPTRRLAITEVGKDERRILTPDLDRNVLDPEFSANGRNIVFRLEDSGQVHFASVRTNGGNLQRQLERRVTVRDYASAGNHTVLLVAQADQPTEIFTFDDGNLAPLTNVNGDLLDGVARAEVEKLRFESADGTPVEAFFVRPVNFDASV